MQGRVPALGVKRALSLEGSSFSRGFPVSTTQRNWKDQRGNPQSSRSRRAVRSGRVPAEVQPASRAWARVRAQPRLPGPSPGCGPAGRTPYLPGQVQIEVPGAQEPQQEGVAERPPRRPSARLPGPAPQLGQAGLQQRRVVGQPVELRPSRRPRPRLRHARRPAPAAARAPGRARARLRPSSAGRPRTPPARPACRGEPGRPLRGTTWQPRRAQRSASSRSEPQPSQ